MMSKREIAGYVVLMLIGAAMLTGFVNNRSVAVEAAYQNFSLRQDADALEVTQELNSAFQQMYQGLRTIARLPAIRALSFNNTIISRDALTGAQEIYNNLFDNLSVSELYIVASDFDPDGQNANSNRSQKPLITFDQRIVGQHADLHKTGKPETPTPESAIEEIEIFEYRVMKRQIEMFQSRFQSESQISGLSYPAVSSEEVITCDNSRYAPSHPNDDDRKGIVYSIPYYDPEGSFAGIISAVVLTSVLSEHLRDSRFTLRNDTKNISIKAPSGELSVKQDNALQPLSASSRPYSKLSKLSFPDHDSSWVLSTSVEDRLLLATPEFAAINTKFWGESIALVSALLLLASALRWYSNRHIKMAAVNAELESLVAERTDALAIAKREADIANAEKSKFLARISHEIRTPLHAIISATELMQTRNPLEADSKKFEIIKSSSRMLADLVNQVLDLSSIEQGRIELVCERFSPEDLVFGVCSLLQSSATQKNIALSHAVKGQLAPFLIGDPRLIRQALTNLVSNAVKYTDHGGVKVVVSSSLTRDQEVIHLEFDVIDTGRGISPDRFGQVFEPFQRHPELARSHSHSTGLGLSITKKLVELMGGRLSFKSEANQGSTFSFVVPVLPSSSNEQNRDCVDQTKAAIGATLILAEDNPEMQHLTGELLNEFGCNYVIARNGFEVVDLLLKQSFDLVLMDCAMPRLSGIDATRLIREREQKEHRRAIPIIAVTANALDIDSAACRAAGMSDFLSKPFTANELRSAIERCLDATSSTQQSNLADNDRKT